MTAREETREKEAGRGQQDRRVIRDHLETRDCRVSRAPGGREEGRESEVRWVRRAKRAEQRCRARLDRGDCRDLPGLKVGWEDRELRGVLGVRGCRD